MKKILAAVMLVTISGSAFADTAGFAFLQVPVGARAVAMGGAFTAVPGDPMGLYWNPATLAEMQEQMFTSTYTGYLMDMQAGFAGWVNPSGDDLVGVSVNYFYGGSFIRTSMMNPTGNGEEFSTNSVSLGGTYVHKFGNSFSVGTTAKFVYSSIDSYSGNAFLVDVGAWYKPGLVSFGFVVRNAGIQTKAFYQENDPVPTTIAAGASAEFLDDRLLIAADVSYPLHGDFNAALGIEYSPMKMLSLRAGGNLHDKNAADNAGGSFFDAIAFGAGTEWNRFDFDYAFKPFADLGNIHRFSIGIAL
ncbi:MAG: PorV/PorQ family protein [Candidatus Aegiribacteria sp.]|nr:PorV/PorQ family protein [Candidatus Aegiribacteria sp.]